MRFCTKIVVMSKHILQCGRYHLDLSVTARPQVMGILNVTPDSFSDGGQFAGLELSLERAEQMIADGVDIIDIGGESTRPGVAPVSLQQELDRVMPVIYALRDCGKPLSIDTYKPAVMREAIIAGADMINDVNAFREAGAITAVQAADVGLCIMHMQGAPQTMQDKPAYEDVCEEVTTFLEERVSDMLVAGIASSRICLDPGFGFGKTLEHNLALLAGIEQMIQRTNLPVLAGLSRKTMIGQITGKPVDGRLAGSVAAALVAVAKGARIVRVHDVAQTVDAMRVWNAVNVVA